MGVQHDSSGTQSADKDAYIAQKSIAQKHPSRSVSVPVAAKPIDDVLPISRKTFKLINNWQLHSPRQQMQKIKPKCWRKRFEKWTVNCQLST